MTANRLSFLFFKFSGGRARYAQLQRILRNHWVAYVFKYSFHMDHIQESLSLGRLCCLFFLCLYCMISCCHLSHCGHPLHLFVRTIYLYLPLKAISFSIVHHNKGQGVEKADVLFQTIAFWKVTRSKIYFDGLAKLI